VVLGGREGEWGIGICLTLDEIGHIIVIHAPQNSVPGLSGILTQHWCTTNRDTFFLYKQPSCLLQEHLKAVTW
jgi:hypothetical protein